MGLFSKKKIEDEYIYGGIKESEKFRTKLMSFIEINKIIKDANKLFSKSMIDDLNSQIHKIDNGINLFTDFVWVKKNESGLFLNSRIENEQQNLQIQTNRIFDVNSIEIDYENFEKVFFSSEDEKHKIKEHVEHLIMMCFNHMDVFSMSDVITFFGKQYEYPNICHFRLLISIKQNEFIIFSSNGIVTIETRHETNRIDTNQTIHKNSLFHSNLKNKIRNKFNDINEEENWFNSINENDEYRKGSEFFLIGQFHFDKNSEKAEHYFKKMSEMVKLENAEYIAKRFRTIGELYLSIDNKINALKWFKIGLKMNEKIGVKKIVDKLQNELN
jgi:hypothetical protein